MHILRRSKQLLRTHRPFSSIPRTLQFDESSTHEYHVMNIIPSVSKLPVLFEDEHMIVVNKPSDMRSVPGAEVVRMTHFKPRTEEWITAVKLAAERGKNDNEMYKTIMDSISQLPNVPRKQFKFISYIRGKFKFNDEELINAIFSDIVTADKSLHSTAFEDIPSHLVSAFDIAENMTGSTLYCVHRLDMETSGVIVFAKNREAAASLGQKFRDREVSKTYIARVAHTVDRTITEVNVPICPDLTNRPYQIVDHNLGKESLTLVRVLDPVKNAIEYEECSEVFPEFRLGGNQLPQTAEQQFERIQRLVGDVAGDAANDDGGDKTDNVNAGVPGLPPADPPTSTTAPASAAQVAQTAETTTTNDSSNDSSNDSASASQSHSAAVWNRMQAVAMKSGSGHSETIWNRMVEQAAALKSAVAGDSKGAGDGHKEVASTTLVELKPHTGRTHQLRVHMAHIGHPMLGDTLYSVGQVREACPRLCLHAKAISFEHPVTGQWMEIDTVKNTLRKRKIKDSDEVAAEGGLAAKAVHLQENAAML